MPYPHLTPAMSPGLGAGGYSDWCIKVYLSIVGVLNVSKVLTLLMVIGKGKP